MNYFYVAHGSTAETTVLLLGRKWSCHPIDKTKLYLCNEKYNQIRFQGRTK